MTETSFEAELLVDCRNELGEGVRWNAKLQCLFWVDIEGAALWSLNPRDGLTESWNLPERIGSFAFRADGPLLVALESGLHDFDPLSGKVTRLTRFEADIPTTRMNDGCCDRQGRFVVGGIEERGLRPFSSVVQYDAAGKLSPLISDVCCSNSIAFSLDGRSLYFADSAERYIYRYDYDPHGGLLGDREIFAVLPVEGGHPDGSTVDAEDHLWNAVWGGARVDRYRPDGSLAVRVTLPVSQITCCTFGGPGLTTLYITTARQGLTDEQLAAQPHAGSLFACDVGVAGVEDVVFAGD